MLCPLMEFVDGDEPLIPDVSVSCPGTYTL